MSEFLAGRELGREVLQAVELYVKLFRALSH